jgi:outer membrane receptor for ferric coprogen and ferric-rhodotorulic acid
LTGRVKCQETAADLTHETYIRLYQSINKNPPDNARALAFRIAVNLAIDYQRKVIVKNSHISDMEQLNKADPTNLKAVNVVGKPIYDTTGPYNPDYSHPNASTANKTDTSIMETPFSVQVVPQQILKDQQVVNLQDATKNISGVQTGFGYCNLYQNFTIRGFETTNILRNGQRNAEGVGRSMVEMANVNSIEVLKGPTEMLYGRLDPGGMVNVITNKPQDTAYYSLRNLVLIICIARPLYATGPLTKIKPCFIGWITPTLTLLAIKIKRTAY